MASPNDSAQGSKDNLCISIQGVLTSQGPGQKHCIYATVESIYGKRRNPLDPRKQALVHLKKFMIEEEQRGRKDVLMIDANEGM